MQKLVDRFLKYVAVDTQSNEQNPSSPSTSGQFILAEMLKQELLSIGLADVELDQHGYLMAKLPANIDYAVPAIGLIAHMDTAPDASGKNVNPQIIDNYQGGDIVLAAGNEVLSPA